MSENGHLSIVANFENLETVKSFACDRAKELGLPDLLLSKIELVMEELFLNIVDHSRPSPKALASGPWAGPGWVGSLAIDGLAGLVGLGLAGLERAGLGLLHPQLLHHQVDDHG